MTASTKKERAGRHAARFHIGFYSWSCFGVTMTGRGVSASFGASEISAYGKTFGFTTRVGAFAGVDLQLNENGSDNALRIKNAMANVLITNGIAADTFLRQLVAAIQKFRLSSYISS